VRFIYRWKDGIKIYVREVMYKYLNWTHLTGSEWGPVAGFFQLCNELVSFAKTGNSFAS
jgi:hypothetical protein